MSFYERPLYAKDYRLAAENKCSKFSSNLAVIYLVYYAITLGVSFIFQLPIFQISTGNFGGEIEISSSWGSTLTIFYAGHFLVSFIAICKIIDNNKKPEVNDLFSGFKNYGNVLGVYLLQTIYTALWTLLFIIPGIVKTYSYAMSLYILDDNKNKSINDCITESRNMMDGHKWELFCLDMSYIGWYILCGFTLGILTLWVEPKHQYARYTFYLKVSGKGLALETKAKEEANEQELEANPLEQPKEETKEYNVLDELDKKFDEIE